MAGGGALAQETTARCAGRGRHGRAPVPNASVTILHAPSGRAPNLVDAEGVFDARGLRSAALHPDISAPGYERRPAGRLPHPARPSASTSTSPKRPVDELWSPRPRPDGQQHLDQDHAGRR